MTPPASSGPVEEQQETVTAIRERVLVNARWRQGRKVGRTIYAQLTAAPLDSDPLIGVMDDPQIAEAVVTAHNASRVPASGDQQ